jgi:Zn-dependent protease with chaperone function
MDDRAFTAMVARLEGESRRSPKAYRIKVALLALLGFGLILTVLLCAGLGIAALAGIVVAIVASGGKALILLLKLGKLLFVIGAALWMLLRSSLSALLMRFPIPQGQEIAREDAPPLFAAIDRMRQRMRGPAFHHVLITEDMNAAVVQRPSFGLIGSSRNYLILGLPLLESLSPEEALAVVAHEYGHLSGQHAHFSAFIYRLRHTWSTIQALTGRWQGLAGRLLRRTIGWYAPYFNAYTFVLARAHEYVADSASSELVGPAVAARALKRVNLAHAQHQRFFEQVLTGCRDRAEPPSDVAEQWGRAAGLIPEPELATRWLAESLNREGSAFDTHPILRVRLAALPGQAESVDTLPPPLGSDTAATAWLGDRLAQLRSVQQAAWSRRIMDGWRQRHEHLRNQCKRLSELRAQDSPALAETAERLNLEVALEPEVDHLPELTAFNRSSPDQPRTLFLEGSLRLDRGDDSGLPILERVMELDPDAIKPVCERAHRYLTSRGDTTRAKQFADRWHERNNWEARRNAELHALNPAHRLVAAGLSPETLRSVRELLRTHGKGIKRAWLARRVLPSDPEVLTYVLGIDLTAWASLRSQGITLVKKLAALDWPMHVFICALNTNRAIGSRLRRLDAAQVFKV